MGTQKSVKDSIHGYIEFTEAYRKIIDTPEFQRLKWIEQTSYRVLYPSARHDRFIHSLGVFHLGGIAFDALMNEDHGVVHDALVETEIAGNRLKELKDAFLAACLLHDIGHAPMSHTLEDLYYQGNPSKLLGGPLHQRLFNALDKRQCPGEMTEDTIKAFKQHYEIMYNNTEYTQPKAHEIVSSIVILERAHELNLTEAMLKNLDLIIRAILGCTYVVTGEGKYKKEMSIKNCLIRLLNGHSVDVDKLDYITRDSAMSGHKNASIDDMRLLKAMTAIEDADKILRPAFRKSALSVIKNVMYAKNAQSRWIINHPAVVYESYLVNKSIEDTMRLFIDKYCRNNDSQPICEEKTCNNLKACKNNKCVIQEPQHLMDRLFSVDALSVDGISIQGRVFRLLCDSDIVSLMKEFMCKSLYIRQLFNRNLRHKPLWKSSEEYVHLFKKNKVDKRITVSDFFRPIFLHAYESEINRDKGILVDDELYQLAQNKDKKDMRNAIEFLRQFKKYGDFVLLPISGGFFSDIDYDRTFFVFGDDKDGYKSYRDLESELIKITDSNVNVEDEYKPFYIHAPCQADIKEILNQLIIKIGGLYPPA